MEKQDISRGWLWRFARAAVPGDRRAVIRTVGVQPAAGILHDRN